MNNYVKESSIINSNFLIESVSISYTNNLKNAGRISIRVFISFFLGLTKLFKHLIFFSPELVYFQISPIKIPFLRDFLFVLILKLFKKKILFHLHGKGIKEEAKNSIKRILYNYAFRKEKVICLSSLLIDDIKDVYKDHPYIVNNGIKHIDAFVPKSPYKNKIVTVLFLSNLLYSKGIIDFLDALEILVKNEVRFKGLIIGEEADLDMNQLNKIMLNKNLLDFVTYIGPKYSEEKNTMIYSSDILVLPTHNDVWGLVILEAMQAGLPVISTEGRCNSRNNR